MTDVVYVVGPPGSTTNEELRYSLRSVEKNLLSVDEAVVVGNVNLKWLKARNVKPAQQGSLKHADARINLRIACSVAAQVSDPFYFFNDDFFVMQEMEEVPVVHRGNLEKGIVSHQMKKAASALRKLGVEPPYFNYECHTPILVYKRPMMKVMDALPDRGLVKTVYMNLMGFGGDHEGNAKVYSTTPRVWERWPLLSTTNGTFASGEVGHFIRDRFPEPSRWEWDQGSGLP